MGDIARSWKLLIAFIMLLALVASMVLVFYPPRQAVLATGDDWSTWMENNSRTGYNGNETAINVNNVSTLKLNWTYKAGKEINTQPVVANGQIYWGAWNGNEYATDLTGKGIWSDSIGGQTKNCSGSQTFGMASSATESDITINGQNTPVVFVGGRNLSTNVESLYALNATTGATIWQTSLNSSTGSFSWSSPALYNGSIYMGISSYDDCPLVQGGLVQVNAATGTIEHTFSAVPTGCLGDSIWSSPTIDEANGIVYVTTGNNGQCSSTETYAQAIIKLNASDLSFVDSWQVPASQHGVDSDFGATPTLFTATYGGSTHEMVGVQNKNGIYYAFDRSSLSAGPVWTANISTSTISISSSAWDGTTLYVAGRTTTISGKSCLGSLRALNPATGSFIWQDCLNDGGVLAPVSAIPGIVFVVEGPHMLVVNTATGAILFNYKTSNNIVSAPSISNGVVYLADSGGTLYALGLSSPPTPTVTASSSPSPTSSPSPSASPGTVLAQDNFQRPNQKLWGTASDGQVWAGNANSLNNFSINNNSGQVTTTTAKGYSALLGPTATDAEVVFSGSISSFSGSDLAAVLRWTSNSNYYKAYITGSKLIIVKKVNGTLTQLASVSFTATANTSYSLRFNVTGSTLSTKVWQTSTTEPGNWMVTATDSSLSSGYCGLLPFLQSNVTATITGFQATSQ